MAAIRGHQNHTRHAYQIPERPLAEAEKRLDEPLILLNGSWKTPQYTPIRSEPLPVQWHHFAAAKALGLQASDFGRPAALCGLRDRALAAAVLRRRRKRATRTRVQHSGVQNRASERPEIASLPQATQK